MPPLPKSTPILVTGAGGFLGRHLVDVLREEFSVTGFDVQNPQNDLDFIIGSVTDTEAIKKALTGMSSLVIGHMAPRAPGVYDTPEIPFDINVKATANLMEAAIKAGIRRVVLISSVSVIGRSHQAGNFLSHELPPSPDSIYALTKTLQEEIVRYYHQNNGIEVAMLRPAYISLGDTLEDKYGRRFPSVNWQFIDPRDIGLAVRAALAVENLVCETFHLMAGPEAEQRADIAYTMKRLRWQPRFRFSEFPIDQPR
ncbi:NAD(P)-dependent oxidoreductase [soil metagenome]